jgi:hypothetical protein
MKEDIYEVTEWQRKGLINRIRRELNNIDLTPVQREQLNLELLELETPGELLVDFPDWAPPFRQVYGDRQEVLEDIKGEEPDYLGDPDLYRLDELYQTEKPDIVGYLLLGVSLLVLGYGIGIFFAPDLFWRKKISTLPESERKEEMRALRVRAGWTIGLGLLGCILLYVRMQ